MAQKSVEVPRNDVVLCGRITSAPQQRTLPSGDELVTFRMSVPRSPTPQTNGSKQLTDWFDCAIWGGRVRAASLGWRVGDVVEARGALRRRYFRGGGTAPAETRVEVEVLGGRVLRRAAVEDESQSVGAEGK